MLVILTDGYLETSTDGKTVQVYTPSNEQLVQMANGMVLPLKLPVSTMEKNYANLEVYLFEVNERKKGIGKHFYGLKKWWSAWFESMKIKNAAEGEFFNQHEDGVISTKRKLDKYINS